ncbi:hypothetical protein LAZ40_03310 [Cereibacter sphaeroides]|uniref:hypothetical protein n=1 Tax=Cereibacter sphaeroides TaxID=1063 RepID=UPI001F2B1836|nr:hypothetical protein [Cereibacter sphaeroides]MCE6958084.1 hypothetical protein [Cereibacter sphaeroides]MCE6971429.1 hypothetical protein [Cereibacter sphaeroides]
MAPLDFLRIEVVHRNGTEILDPNGILLAMMRGENAHWAADPDRRSLLSGEPALLYRCIDCEIPLSPEELRRLVTLDLRPDEFRKLKQACGIFHEIHDDFYDPETGEAVQPRR